MREERVRRLERLRSLVAPIARYVELRGIRSRQPYDVVFGIHGGDGSVDVTWGDLCAMADALAALDSIS